MRNRVRVTICGKTYSIQTDENGTYVTALAKELDRRINEFMEDNNASFPSAAVMTALALMDETAKATSDVDNFRAQIKGYVEEAAAARIEAERSKREAERLRQENEKLKSDMELLNLRNEVSNS